MKGLGSVRAVVRSLGCRVSGLLLPARHVFCFCLFVFVFVFASVCLKRKSNIIMPWCLSVSWCGGEGGREKREKRGKIKEGTFRI